MENVLLKNKIELHPLKAELLNTTAEAIRWAPTMEKAINSMVEKYADRMGVSKEDLAQYLWKEFADITTSDVEMSKFRK